MLNENILSILKRSSRIWALFAALVLSTPVFAQDEKPNYTADYINSTFYYRNLDVLRGSYSRWDNAAIKEPELAPQSAIYGATYNFNYGRNIEGATRIPILFGLALGNTTIGAYALSSTSHMRIFDPADNWEDKLDSDSEQRFTANTIGVTYRNKWFGVLGDLTYIQSNWSFFAQLSIPILKTRAGLSYSQFQEELLENGNPAITRGDAYNPEYFFITTSLIPSLNLGLNVLNYSDVKVSPKASFSLYQLRKKEKWGDIRFDTEVNFQTNAPSWSRIMELQDYDLRVTFYWMSREKMSNTMTANLMVKPTLIVAFSYKSEVDYFAETLSSSGNFYKNLTGWGGEIGGGVRVLGFKQYGAVEETFMKLVLYYNYTEHNEMYPPLIGGIKFKVTY